MTRLLVSVGEHDMGFTNLLDNPLFGNHGPLILGWSDDQLKPLVDRLAPLLPENLTGQMQLAIASVAKSIVTERTKTGRGVHYARGKEAYRVPVRYRSGDPRYSWYYITRSMDILEHIGLITQVTGLWCPGNKGFESVAWATDKLVALLVPSIDVDEQRELSAREETIVLRDREDKAQLDYNDTDDTTVMRAQLAAANRALSRLDIRHGGRHFEIPVLRRIFNGSFDRGGRLYCNGPSFQNMPAEERRKLEVVIEGITYPMVEIDFSNLHVEMAYREARKKMPRGDQYHIEGFDRALVKMAVNTVLNARSDNSGILAIAHNLYYDTELRTRSGIGGTRRECRELAKRVVTAIKSKHHRIKKYFGTDCGARFQRRDSDMAMQIMLGVARRTGRAPLPIHDSFLVAEIDAEALAETMREVADEYKLRPTLKVLHQGQPTLLIFHLEVTASDVRKWGGWFDPGKQAFRGGYTPKALRRDDVPRCPSTGFMCCHDPPVEPRCTDERKHLSLEVNHMLSRQQCERIQR